MTPEPLNTESASVKNRRIAKNTLLLYVRTMFTMCISLYTSRIILQALGVDNYGVYNVVGGFVAMFGIVTGPISGAISRFLTYGLGKGDINHLKKVFSTSINIQLVLGFAVLLLGETVGIWFLNYKLNIPSESIIAAQWVLQCSILSTILGLINIPYSSAIIAHEKMGVFAYMSILDVMLKLTLVLLLLKIPYNSLIVYSVGLVGIGLLERMIYGWYCTRKFNECHYQLQMDRDICKEMTGFAWWTFFGNTAYIFNTQGVNMLMNIFFGVVVNTAKGIAMQVEAAVITFVNSFTMAFTPQITKSYAEGNTEYMYSLMCRGSKYSMFLLLYFLIPLEFEAHTVLRLWLGEIPPGSVLFLRLSLLCTAAMVLGNPFYQGIMATGKIRSYQIAITTVGVLVFPLTWLLYSLGYSPEIFYWIFFIIYNILVWIRIWYVKKILGFKIRCFFRKVFLPIIYCSFLSAIPAYVISTTLFETTKRLFVLSSICIITTSLFILLFGMTKDERRIVLSKIQNRIKI